MSGVSILSKIFVFNTLATVLIIAGHYIFATNQVLIDQSFENVLDSFTSDQDRFLVFVSTMDGYVSALNGKTGQLQWTLSTGSGSLLSSSISERPMIRHGRETRLVPSLDGGLFQMDEGGVEAIPIGADTLLSSTVKLYDSSTVVGGRTIESYAIDLASGKVKYICSLNGCELVDSNANDSMLKQTTGDVLLIRRNDRVIRLIEMLSGIERWNYSVGQHDLTFVSSVDVIKSIEQLISNSKVKKNHVNHSERLFKNGAYDDSSDDSGDESLIELDDLSIKVHMSSGLIKAISKNDLSHEYWNYKFESAVAAVWKLEGDKLIEMDLFDDENIIEFETPLDQSLLGSRSLYIGRYNDQPYIQPSPLLRKEMDVALDEMTKLKDTPIGMPKIKWKPYLYNALSRTRTIKNCDDCEASALVPSMNEQYPFDGGSYLRREFLPIKQISYVDSGNAFSLFNSLNSFLPYWKEMVVMILMILATPLIWSSLQHFSTHRVVCLPPSQTVATLLPLQNEIQINILQQPSLSSLNFNSRYQADFKHLECLGKGGFGVVFKARNILDDCDYAVKRIALYDSESARGRVMREVKALAKLDHPGIVRYYQSWFENPPLGWHESQDSAYIDMSLAPSDNTSNPMSSDLKHRKVKDPNDLLENCSANHVFDGSVSNNDLLCDNYDDNATRSAIFEFSSSFEEKNKDENFSIVFADEEGGSKSLDLSKGKCFNQGLDTSNSIVFMDEAENKLSHRPFKRQLSTSTTDSALKKIYSSTDVSIKASKSMCNKKWQKEHKISLKKVDKSSHNENRRKGVKSYLYIQMQLCKTESLKDWLQSRKKNEEGRVEERGVDNQSLDIFYQIVSAIEYVHSQNLMHRDLKPSNIFFAMDGLVKIGDFGLVTAIEDSYEDEGYKSRSSNLQHTKRVGTRLYMSPEQSACRKYTNKVDIYALGVIFFELFNLFSTEMERIQSLLDLHEYKYPPKFLQLHKEEFEFMKPLLSIKPQDRPDASQILEEELLRPYDFYRIPLRPRNSSKSFTESSPLIEGGTPPRGLIIPS